MADKIDDGGRAFPVPDEGQDWGSAGMSLRQWYAGQALAGLLANSGGPIQVSEMTAWGFANCNKRDVAALCLTLADAMIAEESTDG